MPKKLLFVKKYKLGEIKFVIIDGEPYIKKDWEWIPLSMIKEKEVILVNYHVTKDEYKIDVSDLKLKEDK